MNENALLRVENYRLVAERDRLAAQVKTLREALEKIQTMADPDGVVIYTDHEARHYTLSVARKAMK